MVDGANWRGASTSGCHLYRLQSGGQLVGGAQAHRQLVAVDRCRSGVCWRISLQGYVDRRQCSMRALSCSQCWDCVRSYSAASEACLSLTVRLLPEPRCAAARRQCNGAIHPPQCAWSGGRIAGSIRHMRRDEQIGTAPQADGPSGSGSGSVTSSAARIWPDCSASTNASVSTIGPRAALTSSAPWRISASWRLPISRCDSSVEGRIRITISACGKRLSSSLTA